MATKKQEEPVSKKKEETSSKKEGISSRVRETIHIEKKPVPETLLKNEGIKYFFYFLYVYALLSILTAINTDMFDLSYWFNLNGILYTQQPLLPPDLLTLFKLNFYSFFIALLGIFLRIFVAVGLAVMAFDEKTNPWLRTVAVPGIVFVIFGLQLIGP